MRSPLRLLRSTPPGAAVTSYVLASGKPVDVLSFRDADGLTRRVTFGETAAGDVLFKDGVVGRLGFVGRWGEQHDGHGKFKEASREGGPGRRDDAYGTAERLGMRGRRWKNLPRSPLSTRALVRDTLRAAERLDGHAVALGDTAALSSSGRLGWERAAQVAEGLQVELRAIEESSMHMGRRAAELTQHATTRAQQQAIATAVATAAAAGQAARAARVAAEKATKGARVAAEAAAKAARVAAEATAKAGRVAAEATARTARAAAEAAVRAARLAAEMSAKAAVALAAATASVLSR